jgi:hypothetical protein
MKQLSTIFFIFFIFISSSCSSTFSHVNTLEQYQTYGAQTIQALGVPKEYSELVYAGMNIGAAANVGFGVVKTAGSAINIESDVVRIDIPNFYVNTQGQAISATGYRYISSDASYLQDLISTGIMPAKNGGTYISFDKMGTEAAGKLQVPPSNNAFIRVEFGTGQILDDISIPKGEWGKSNSLEPITQDFPQFGSGGATQATTSKPIVIDKIIDTRTGEVLYERSR